MKRDVPPKLRIKRTEGANRVIAMLLCAFLCISTLLFNVANSKMFGIGLADGSNPALDRIFSLLSDGQEDPQTFSDYEELANIAIAREAYEEALPHIDQCIALADAEDEKTMAALLTRKGSVFALLLRNDEAMECLNEALALDVGAANALMLRAQIYIEQNDLESAAEDLEEYLKIEPENASIWAGLAQLYEALSEFEKARACYDESFALGDGDTQSLLNRARSSYLMGNYEEALADYNAYLAESKDEGGVAHFLRGVCLMQMLDYEKAAVDILAALEAGYPDEALCYEQLSVCAYALEQYEDVLTYAEKVLSFEGAQVSLDVLYQRMGVSQMGLERYEEAVSSITASMEHNPDLEGNAYYRGVCNLALEAFDQAIADFTDSIAQDFLVQFCYYNRGVCHVQAMNYEEALDDMEKTLSAGDNADLIAAARDILWQMAQYYMNNPDQTPSPNQTALPIDAQALLLPEVEDVQ